MALKITKLIINADGHWGVEIENVSGGPISAANYLFEFSTVDGAGFVANALDSYDPTITTIADGARIILGSRQLPETNVKGSSDSTFGTADTYDSFVIRENFSPFGVVDSIGDSNSGSPSWSFDTIYTADIGRVQDTVTSDNFSMSTSFTSQTYCFAKGTRIATATGDCPVEALEIGTMIRMLDGGLVPVKWVGRQTLSTRFGPAERLMPVRVAAGALGGGLPQRDLTLTADHALFIEGLLVNASALVNGTTITRVPLSELGETFAVYHVETETHDIILAEGTPAESFIDYAGRKAFDNFAEYASLYGDEAIVPEMAHPRVSSARLLPASLRRRFFLREVA